MLDATGTCTVTLFRRTKDAGNSPRSACSNAFRKRQRLAVEQRLGHRGREQDRRQRQRHVRGGHGGHQFAADGVGRLEDVPADEFVRLRDEQHAGGAARGGRMDRCLRADGDAADLLHLDAARKDARPVGEHQLPAHVQPGVRVDAASRDDPPVADVDDGQRARERARERPQRELAPEREAPAADLDVGGVGADARLLQLVVLAERPAIARRRHTRPCEARRDVIGGRVELRRRRVAAQPLVGGEHRQVPGQLLRRDLVGGGAHRTREGGRLGAERDGGQRDEQGKGKQAARSR